MLVDPEAFERCFLGWVQAVFRSDKDVPRQIAIDGKTVRRSFDRKHGRSPLHLVSAYATEHGLVLAQRAAEEKKGELTVLPELLDGLDLCGCLVSLDALACRPEIAQQIGRRGGDYLITLKGNQRKVHAEVRDWFATNAFARGGSLQAAQVRDRAVGRDQEDHAQRLVDPDQRQVAGTRRLHIFEGLRKVMSYVPRATSTAKASRSDLVRRCTGWPILCRRASTIGAKRRSSEEGGR